MLRTVLRVCSLVARVSCRFPLISRLSARRAGVFQPAGLFLRAFTRSCHARTVIGAASAALALGVALSACSPTFDWRTVMNNDKGYTVDFPAKPGNDQRAVQIGGTPMQMAMQTAEAGNAVFAVGTVMLPDDSDATQRAALDFLRAGLARNVGATPDAHSAQIPLAAGGKIPGLEMTVSGAAGAKHETRTVYARLVARGRHVYQAAIIADQPLPQDQVDQFFSSFQLY
ncbi:hypothetical protein [Paraburkholderia sp. UCT70]|uniref:hypothetical protein n=1 Tax=Paraburkholderia sp. UCT70 TaxID=2991068 RepID=UPI003D248DE6